MNKSHGQFWRRIGSRLMGFALAAGVFSPVVEVRAEEKDLGKSSDWQFTYFGVSTGEDRNKLVSGGNGIEDPVTLHSAIFENGSIKTKGGKFVADAPADGGSYYYTTIDPSKENF
jgi:hypothetical protein